MNTHKILFLFGCKPLYIFFTSFHEFVELISDFFDVGFSEIRVNIHRGGELLVTENFLHHFRRDTVLKRDRRERVSELVCCARYPGRFFVVPVKRDVTSAC